jgi:hypothetical protein
MMLNETAFGGALLRRGLKGLIVVLALAAGALIPGVNSATALANSTAVAVASVTTTPATAQNADRGFAVCGIPVPRGNFTGEALCNTNVLNVPYPDGTWETFVVGIDTRLHHIWQRFPGDTQWSGWQWVPGGGIARDGIWLQTESPLVLMVVGTDYHTYCNVRGTSWSGWNRC